MPKTASQLQRVEGAPFGTRGGVSVMHTFPADGEYVFRMELHGNADGFLFGGPASGEQIELSINGVRKALVDIDPRMADVTTGLALKTPPIQVPAGAQRVTAAFIQRFDGPVNDLIAPIDHTLADTQIGVAYGITTLPHLKDLSVVGPQRVTGVSATASRRKIFTCRPTAASEERPCATQIVKALATQAFRRPVTDRDLQGLMRFYDDGREAGRFRARRGRGARGDAGEPAVPLPARSGGAAAHRRQVGADRRSRSGLAPLLLPLGHGAGRRADGGRLAGAAERAGDARETGQADARRPAVGDARRRGSRRSGSA